MPYGKFNNDEHFNTGLQVGLGNAMFIGNIKDGILEYVQSRYGKKAGNVIAGIATGFMERGLKIPAVGLLQGSDIKFDKEAVKVLDSVYTRSEEMFLSIKDDSETGESETDKFLKKIKIEPTY
ncbi:MAG: hypothetical protein GTN37_02760 [Candidatus Aenigmarchaeota archaeon]|nr:hypothetical protein [Candidatus Aenigmarchaeota archaeon]NIQ18440.1 hypothetical protein [Candidatus Aenigmarchaeota archaeon]NIS73324.1 hypothetical protein [Candidatus Aenigmarchaeota archaeon]